MKKNLCTIMILITTFISVCLLTSCGNNNQYNDTLQLEMDKKYIDSYDISDDEYEQAYYIFHSNGTGEHRYYAYGDFEKTYYDYKINFKYTYTDNEKSSVVCFFDSIEYGDKNTCNFNPTKWNRLLMVSKNVLCIVNSSGYSYYINKDYLDTIPNYCP